jgi:hypothetical protein
MTYFKTKLNTQKKIHTPVTKKMVDLIISIVVTAAMPTCLKNPGA